MRRVGLGPFQASGELSIGGDERGDGGEVHTLLAIIDVVAIMTVG